MKAFFLLVLTFLVCPKLFAEPTLTDSNQLLHEVDQFLSANRVPECEEITEYDWAKCDTKCDNSSCQIQRCSLMNNDGVVGGTSRFKTVKCTKDTIGILFKPRFPHMGHQTWFERHQFSNAESSIKAAIGAFLPWTVEGRCPLFGKKGVGQLDFWTSHMIIEQIKYEDLKMKSGLVVPSMRISGSIKLPVRNVQPGCRNTMVESKFDLWMGKGISQAEQFLRFDFDSKTIFKITNTSRK